MGSAGIISNSPACGLCAIQHRFSAGVTCVLLCNVLTTHSSRLKHWQAPSQQHYIHCRTTTAYLFKCCVMVQRMRPRRPLVTLCCPIADVPLLLICNYHVFICSQMIHKRLCSLKTLQSSGALSATSIPVTAAAVCALVCDFATWCKGVSC